MKLDSVTELSGLAPPTSGFWEKGRRIWNSDPKSGTYVGWVNNRIGQAAPQWNSIHSYNVGDLVVPINDNGHFYKCIQAGYSGPYEPNWPVTTNSTVDDTKNVTTWSPSKYYSAFDIVFPTTNNGRFYVCTVEGQSGTSEPIWSTSNGVATSDNKVVWIGYKIVKWQESGVASLFKGFGLIE